MQPRRVCFLVGLLRPCFLVLVSATPGFATAQGTIDWHRARLMVGTSPTLAYDLARERTVFCNGETWEWNGRSWAQAASVPANVTPLGMVYDSQRRRCIVAALLGPMFIHTMSTWEWDGYTWTNRQPAVVPPLRLRTAMAYDAARQRVVLFGGSYGWGNDFDDTWEWDGANWARVATTRAPSPRTSAMAYDHARQRIVLFGGSGAALLSTPVPYDDTWEYDGTDWTLIARGGPPARSLHGLVYDYANRRTVLHGGWASPVNLDDTWSWNGIVWTPIPSPRSPGTRSSFGMAYDAARQRVVRNGGTTTGGELFDTWELDPPGWAPVGDETAPRLQPFARLAYDSARQRTVMFGDLVDATVWEWDGRLWERRPTTGAWPMPRIDHGMAYDAARQRTVVCGGRDQSSMLAETWEWDGARWSLRASGANSPLSDWGNHLVYDEVRQRCVFWNGTTHEWDGAVWTQTSTQTLLRNAQRAMAYDATRQRVVMLECGSTSSTWIYDGVSWTRAQPATSPPVLTNISMTFDRARQLAVATGVPSGANAIATWSWNGSDWAPIATPTAPWAIGSGLAYDTANGQVVTAGPWLLGPVVRASSADYGSGCGGTGGSPRLHGGVPHLGNEGFALELHVAQPSVPCIFAAAASAQAVPLGAGCTLLVQPSLTAVFAAANASGVAWLEVAIPWRTALRGLPVFWQAAALEAGGPLGGLSLANGRRTVLGD